MDAMLDPSPAPVPSRTELKGAVVTVAPLDAASHASALFESTHGPEAEILWRYMSDGPYANRDAFREGLILKQQSEDPMYFTILDNRTGRPMGYASYLRITPPHRVIEVGNIMYSPELQRTRGATEAMYLMARHAFESLGYRRYEWKCNALNVPSRRAALRLGFQFEGIFRQHMIIKGRNRDTAWFAMLDSEWPERKLAFERWLHPSNFDSNGRQRISLSQLNSGDRQYRATGG